MRYVEFMKQVVPLHDDLFDFFYEALPGYEHVGQRRILLGCWGSLNDPRALRLQVRAHDRLGPARCSSRPGVVVDGKLVTNDLVDINLGIRILLGTPTTRTGRTEPRVFVERDPLGNPVDRNHPWNQHTIPKPQQARLRRQVQLDHVAALVRRHRPPRARHRRRADRPAVVDGAVRAGGHRRLRQVHRAQRRDQPAADRRSSPRSRFEWKIPQWSNALERNRARTYFQAYAAALALHFVEQGAGRGPGRAHRHLDAVRGARRGVQRAGSPRRCAAC